MTDFLYCPRCGGGLEPPLADAKAETPAAYARCVAQGCGFVHWDNPTPVVAAVIVNESRTRALLVQNVGWPDGVFALVTGFLEARESPQIAVAREVLEETGLVASSVTLLGNDGFAGPNQVILAYEVRVDDRQAVRLNHELAASRWVAAEKLRAWPFGTGFAVEAWIERFVPSTEEQR